MAATDHGRRFRKATIKDVAQHAGVSTTTVSVFVSGRENVCSPETAERIRAAVAALHYTPSSLIRGAQNKVTHTIGVCMRSPMDPELLYGNPFFERLWRGIGAEADETDYSLLRYPLSVRDLDAERVEPFLDGRVDGVLFHAHENARAARTAMAGMPTVLLTRSLHLPEGCGAAWTNEAQTADRALSHLWALGHRRIAHIAGPVGHGKRQRSPDAPRGTIWADDVAVRRLDEYASWMDARGVYSPDLVFYADSWQGENLPRIMASWLQMTAPPTAVFCANDVLAVGIIAAARQAAWNVPEDLSVIGVDNAPPTPEFGRDWMDAPALTTVDPATENVGREGVRCLLRLMRGAPLAECRVAVPVASLVERSTTTIAPSRR